MAGASIVQNQAGKPPGVAGQSREDFDLFSGANPVVLTNADDTGVISHSWILLDKPILSAAVILNPNSPTASIQIDVRGSYKIRLTVIDGSGTVSQERIAAVKLDNEPGWRIPAAGESVEFHATRGWAQEVEEILRDISEGRGLKMLRIPARAADPLGAAGIGQYYAKTVGGITEAFYVDSAGTATRITNDGILDATLQTAYVLASSIITDAVSGRIRFARGAGHPANQPVLLLEDTNLATGRTASLLSLTDTNVLGVTPDPVIRLQRDNVTNSPLWMQYLLNTNSALVGPGVEFFTDHATPAQDHILGQVLFSGRNSVAAKTIYAQLSGSIENATTAAGRLRLDLATGGVLARVLELFGRSASGGEAGLIFQNRRASVAGVPAWTFRVTTDYPTGEILFQIEEDNGDVAADVRLQLLAEGKLVIRGAAGAEPGVRIENSAGTGLFAVQMNNSFAQFSNLSALGIQLYNTVSPGANSAAEVLQATGVAGAGNPMFAIRRDATNRIFQMDGDTLSVWTARTTAKGVELQLYHDDGAAAGTGEISAEITAYGKDGGNAKQQLAAIQFRFHTVTAGAEVGQVRFQAVGGGTLRTFLDLYSPSGGALYESQTAAGAVAAHKFAAPANFGADQPVFQIYKGNPEVLLFQIDGDDHAYLPLGGRLSIGTSDPLTTLTFKSHTGFALSEERATTAAVTTTGTTIATLFEFDIPLSTVWTFFFHVEGRESADAHFASYVRAVRVRRTGAGAPSVGTPANILTDVSDGTWVLTMDQDGATKFRIRVTGGSSQTVHWRTTVYYAMVGGST